MRPNSIVTVVIIGSDTSLMANWSLDKSMQTFYQLDSAEGFKDGNWKKNLVLILFINRKAERGQPSSRSISLLVAVSKMQTILSFWAPIASCRYRLILVCDQVAWNSPYIIHCQILYRTVFHGCSHAIPIGSTYPLIVKGRPHNLERCCASFMQIW